METLDISSRCRFGRESSAKLKPDERADDCSCSYAPCSALTSAAVKCSSVCAVRGKGGLRTKLQSAEIGREVPREVRAAEAKKRSYRLPFEHGPGSENWCASRRKGSRICFDHYQHIAQKPALAVEVARIVSRHDRSEFVYWADRRSLLDERRCFVAIDRSGCNVYNRETNFTRN